MRRTHRRSCSRSCCCSWAILVWRSACGRTSFHRPYRSGKPPGRRKAWASRWSVRFSSFPSSSPTPQCPITYSAERSEPARDTTDGCATIRRRTDMASEGRLACSDLGGQCPGAGRCRGPFQSGDESRRADRVKFSSSYFSTVRESVFARRVATKEHGAICSSSLSRHNEAALDQPLYFFL